MLLDFCHAIFVYFYEIDLFFNLCFRIYIYAGRGQQRFSIARLMTANVVRGGGKWDGP